MVVSDLPAEPSQSTKPDDLELPASRHNLPLVLAQLAGSADLNRRQGLRSSQPASVRPTHRFRVRFVCFEIHSHSGSQHFKNRPSSGLTHPP